MTWLVSAVSIFYARERKSKRATERRTVAKRQAEGRYCVSEFFCPSIAEFFNTTDLFEDDELEEFFASIMLKVLRHCPTHFPGPY